MARDLNDTLIFVKVVEHGSFISAARALRLPKTTVSRKVQELETRLGAQLLHRTTRKLGLTEAGNIYFEHCQRISRELDEAESAVGQLQGGPRGWLRFTAPYSIGITWIAPLLGEFHARHPEVRVDMVLTNEPLDIIDKETRRRPAHGQPARLQPDRAQARHVPHPGLRQPQLHRAPRRAAASGRPAAPPHAGDAEVPSQRPALLAAQRRHAQRRLPCRSGAGRERSRRRSAARCCAAKA